MENKEGAFKAGCRERAGQGRAYLFFFLFSWSKLTILAKFEGSKCTMKSPADELERCLM